MNTKFFVSGLIVSKLMSIKKMTALELAEKMGKTRTAIYLIMQRPVIKDLDAEKIIEAIGFEMDEVIELDRKGKFNGIAVQPDVVLIDEPQNEYLKTKLENIEAFFASENAYLREQSKLKDEDLRRKDMVIQDLVSQLGKKHSPVTNDPEVLCKILQLNKIDGYIPSFSDVKEA